jgi:glutathione reductase (NADPH)
MQTTHFDCIIIGSGTSAYYCAEGLLAAGKSVAIVDERPFGGTCALRGCQPKKYLVANSEAVSAARHLLGRGIQGNVSVDWSGLQSLKNDFLAGRSEAAFEDWKNKGATPIRGRARFKGENSIEVNDDILTAETIVIASGSTPVRNELPGSEHLHVSDDFLELPELPRRILFVGGGYISCEFAFVAAVAGCRVTILQRSGTILKGFDPDMVGVVRAAAGDLGIRIRTGDTLASVEQADSALRATGNSGEIYEADLIIEAIGRRPNLSVLEGGLGKVTHGRRGVEVNEYLQSVSNPRVYAIGDCADRGLMLATVAEVIKLFGLAIQFGITAGQLANFPYAYPTMSSDVKYMVR